jgi:hypothetical protein
MADTAGLVCYRRRGAGAFVGCVHASQLYGYAARPQNIPEHAGHRSVRAMRPCANCLAPSSSKGPPLLILTVQETAQRAGRFDGFVEGFGSIVTSRQQFLDGARALLAKGVDPAEVLIMRHADTGTDSLRSTVGEAAKWRVAEEVRGSAPKLRKWESYTGRPDDDENE